MFSHKKLLILCNWWVYRFLVCLKQYYVDIYNCCFPSENFFPDKLVTVLFVIFLTKIHKSALRCCLQESVMRSCKPLIDYRTKTMEWNQVWRPWQRDKLPLHLDEVISYLRLFCSSPNSRYASKKKAFSKASKKWTDDLGKKSIEDNFKKMIRYCKYVRIICHSQVIFRVFFF